SIHPPAWWKGPLGPLTTGRDLGGVGLLGPACRDHPCARRRGVRAGVRPELRTFRGPDRREDDRRAVGRSWVVRPAVARPCHGLLLDGASPLEADALPPRGAGHAPARAAATRRPPAPWRRIPGAGAREKSLRGVELPEPVRRAAPPGPLPRDPWHASPVRAG